MCRSDTELLLDYAHRGDVEALSVLIKRHEAWLMVFLRGMLSSADADDAFQQVWFQVIKTVDGYRGGVVKAYLVQIARNIALMRLRKISRSECLSFGSEDGCCDINEIPDAGLSPIANVEFMEDSENICRAVKSLPSDEREVLLLRIEGEMTLSEVARTLGRPLGTAVSQLGRAVKHLKELLGVKTSQKEGV